MQYLTCAVRFRPMGLEFETRVSDSPWISSVWACRSDQVAEMTSVATETWGLVFWEQDGTAYAAVTGPEASSGTAPVPTDASFVGDPVRGRYVASGARDSGV